MLLQQYCQEGQILELSICNPPANLMSLEILEALRVAINEAPSAGVRGIVISGQPGVFSSGIDVFTLLSAERAYIERYWQAVFGLAASMALCPIPVISAISGHCLASGALIAVLSDYRIMAEGQWKFGFSEVQAGIVLPDCFQLALRRLISPHRASCMLMFGELVQPQQAVALGLVDELCSPSAASAKAIERLSSLIALPEQAVLEIRRMNRRGLAQSFESLEALPIKAFIDDFLSPAVQHNLRQIAAQMLQRVRRRQALAS